MLLPEPGFEPSTFRFWIQRLYRSTTPSCVLLETVVIVVAVSLFLLLLLFMGRLFKNKEKSIHLIQYIFNHSFILEKKKR